MIRFPLFESLDVVGYGLYPGDSDDPGLHARFLPGTTLIMGANGLGKTTMISLLYRMCTGPTDLTGIGSAVELGYSQLATTGLGSFDTRTFAVRVNDGAASASATLTFVVGEVRITVSRSLNNLRLSTLEVDGEQVEASEDSFQRCVTEAAGLDSFIDWILIQRYLTFYGDDRRSLVWDRTAQRQVLRLLFLPPEESGRWLGLEREFLRQATQYRNLRAVLSREEAFLKKEEAKLARSPTITAAIEGLTERAKSIESELDALGPQIEEAELAQRTAQLDALRAAEDRERAYRSLEHGRLQEIQVAFPDASMTATYLLGQILSGNVCIACGNEVAQFAENLRIRLANNECVVCGSPVSGGSPLELTDLDEAERQLQEMEVRIGAVSRVRDEAISIYASLLDQVRALEDERTDLETQLVRLHASLPDADRKVKDRRANMIAMRARAEELRKELDLAQQNYKDYVHSRVRTIGKRKDEVKLYFAKFAREFLVESCDLTWDRYLAYIGQINEPTEFFAFQVDMTGGAIRSATRRERSDDVSESQREFIDIAFRMALISVAGDSRQGSLVIDTPESSLDAVFAPRAARVLANFGVETPDNRLIVTSNLIDGALIPTLLGLAGITHRGDARIVDLIALAEPTAAVRELRTSYDNAVDKIFDRVAEEFP